MKIRLAVLFACIAMGANAQKYTSEKSTITFFSSATLEDIKADNTKASSVFDASNGNIAFVVPINEFQFKKSLMQEQRNIRSLHFRARLPGTMPMLQRKT
jgi:hypothetical protein